MNKKEAENQFKLIYPEYKKLDDGEKRLSWAIFTDGLCKDGEITEKQFANWDYPRYFNLKC